MTKYEFDLIFALPEGEFDAFDLSDAVYEAGFEDAVVGTGQAGLLGVNLEAEGEDAELVIVKAARAILKYLPKGSSLREVRPDLVSLADVAKKLDVSRQTLQKRQMPLPAIGGQYRVTEIADAISAMVGGGRRKVRMNISVAEAWLNAGYGAQLLNARIALGEVDAKSLEYKVGVREIPAAYQAKKAG